MDTFNTCIEFRQQIKKKLILDGLKPYNPTPMFTLTAYRDPLPTNDWGAVSWDATNDDPRL